MAAEEGRVVIEKLDTNVYEFNGWKYVGRLLAHDGYVRVRQLLEDRAAALYWANRMANRYGCRPFEIKGSKEVPLPRS